MDMNYPRAESSAGKPGPITFSLTLPRQALEGTIAISPDIGDSHLVAIELQLAGIRLGSATLTEERRARSGAAAGWGSHESAEAELRSSERQPNMCDRLLTLCADDMQPLDVASTR